MVEQTLHRQRDRDDDGANSGDDPRRSEFKRHSFSMTTHFLRLFLFDLTRKNQEDKGTVLLSLYERCDAFVTLLVYIFLSNDNVLKYIYGKKIFIE